MDFSKHKLLEQAYQAMGKIEKCGASDELTDAVSMVSDLATNIEKMVDATALAYGILWHINTDPVAPIQVFSPEQAACKSRQILREQLNKRIRGDGIKRATDMAVVSD